MFISPTITSSLLVMDCCDKNCDHSVRNVEVVRPFVCDGGGRYNTYSDILDCLLLIMHIIHSNCSYWLNELSSLRERPCL